MKFTMSQIMLTHERKYDFVCTVMLKRSHVLKDVYLPKDDILNWLFLETKDRLFSFVYKIENPNEAKYNQPFRAKVAFTMYEEVKFIVKLNETYKILRGQENIGWLTINEFVY